MFAIFFNIECNQPSPHLRHHVGEAGGEDDPTTVAGQVGEAGEEEQHQPVEINQGGEHVSHFLNLQPSRGCCTDSPLPIFTDQPAQSFPSPSFFAATQFQNFSLLSLNFQTGRIQ